MEKLFFAIGKLLSIVCQHYVKKNEEKIERTVFSVAHRVQDGVANSLCRLADNIRLMDSRKISRWSIILITFFVTVGIPLIVPSICSALV